MNAEEAIKEKNRLLTTFGMAPVKIYKFTAQFVRHFELELANKDRSRTTNSTTFAFRSDFWVKLRTRQVAD